MTLVLLVQEPFHYEQSLDKLYVDHLHHQTYMSTFLEEYTQHHMLPKPTLPFHQDVVLLVELYHLMVVASPMSMVQQNVHAIYHQPYDLISSYKYNLPSLADQNILLLVHHA